MWTQTVANYCDLLLNLNIERTYQSKTKLPKQVIFSFVNASEIACIAKHRKNFLKYAHIYTQFYLFLYLNVIFYATRIMQNLISAVSPFWTQQRPWLMPLLAFQWDAKKSGNTARSRWQKSRLKMSWKIH